jgi:transposase
MGLVVEDDGWRIPDEVWAQMEPLLPERPAHALGCHNPRVPDRDAMNAILLVLRTEMQWHALGATGICSCSSASRRFREWAEAGGVPRVLAAWAARLRRRVRDRMGAVGDGRCARDGAVRRRADGPESH